MNLVGIARHGIGIAGVPPVAIAIARGLAIDSIQHADRASLTIQVAADDAEAAWLTRIGPAVQRVPLPRGIAFALRVGSGESTIGVVVAAEHETDLGDRLGVVIRVGESSIELDRRDGARPLGVSARLVDIAQAQELVQGLRD